VEGCKKKVLKQVYEEKGKKNKEQKTLNIHVDM
jgi:hypothetical protein